MPELLEISSIVTFSSGEGTFLAMMVPRRLFQHILISVSHVLVWTLLASHNRIPPLFNVFVY